MDITFLTEKQYFFLSGCIRRDAFLAKTARRGDLDPYYATKILNAFEKKGVLKTYRDGRKRLISITDKGLELLTLYSRVEELMKL